MGKHFRISILLVLFSSHQHDGLVVEGKRHRSNGPHPEVCTALNPPPAHCVEWIESLAVLVLEKSVPLQLEKSETSFLKV